MKAILLAVVLMGATDPRAPRVYLPTLNAGEIIITVPADGRVIENTPQSPYWSLPGHWCYRWSVKFGKYQEGCDPEPTS